MSNTVKIRKGNKVRFVEVGRLDSFLQQGFEQIDEKGNVVRRATGGSVVPIAKYNKLLDEIEELKNQLSQNEEVNTLKEEIEQLKKENAALKGKITKLEKEKSGEK